MDDQVATAQAGASVSSAPGWARSVNRLVRYLSTDFLGGPRPVKLAWVINFQKGGTLPFIALLMWFYGNYSTVAWVYLALHGTYGLCWLLKHFAFRDRSWEARATIGGAALSFLLVLGPYWLIAWLLISGVLGPDYGNPSNALLAFAIGLHTLGVAIMLSADAQKHFSLRLQKRLIADGLFRHVRHPNYLGEIMIYASYAIIVGHWLPWATLVTIWLTVFLTNMLMIESSLSRYPEWNEYRKRTGLLIPKFVGRGRGD